MRPAVRPRRIGAPLAALLLLTAAAGCTAAQPGPPQAGPSPYSAVPVSTSPAAGTAASSTASSPDTPAFDPTRRSVDDPGSLWVVVDKLRPLRPRNWVPDDLVQPDVPHTNTPLLRAPAARALERLVADAADDGVAVVSLSAYRSYETQRTIHERNVRALGRRAAERLTARPGYSEHQTGLADDLGDGSGRCPIQACFATTPAGAWLADHAWRYGFVERYPRGGRDRTGIQWEPWHHRFVGRELARHMRDTGQPVLEDVLSLPPSPDYR